LCGCTGYITNTDGHCNPYSHPHRSITESNTHSNRPTVAVAIIDNNQYANSHANPMYGEMLTNSTVSTDSAATAITSSDEEETHCSIRFLELVDLVWTTYLFRQCRVAPTVRPRPTSIPRP
jgi:hypothetical protein